MQSLKLTGERIIPLHLNYLGFLIQKFNKKFIYKSKVFYYEKIQCEFCERKDVHQHHIIPIADFGANTKSNLILLCPHHHLLADYGSLKINAEGKINYAFYKKSQKLLRKYYKEYQEAPITFQEEFIENHLEKDYIIKYFIRYKPERVKEFKEEHGINQVMCKKSKDLIREDKGIVA